MKLLIALLITITAAAAAISAQTTALTYQGRLTDTSVAANGNYEFEFVLFDAGENGTQIALVTRSGVPVAAGVFNVELDFGTPAFPGANRFLEIRVKRSTDPPGTAFTPLTPRQSVTSSPYSIRSLNAATADTATTTTNAANFTGSLTGDVTGTQTATVVNTVGGQAAADVGSATQRVFDATPSASPGNTLVKRDADGNFSGNIIDANIQYNLGGSRVLSIAGAQNLFVGETAGLSNSEGFFNTFAGSAAGVGNTDGLRNSFFGNFSGAGNTLGNNNSFFGNLAGTNTGSRLAKSLFGNPIGSNNSFFGNQTGLTNTTGSNNTLIGNAADVATENLNFATAIGAGSEVGTSNSVVLGRSNDIVKIPGALNVAGSTTYTGTFGASVVEAATQFNIGGFRVLTTGAGANTGANDFYAGPEAGANATSGGFNNSFFGTRAGYVNAGEHNSFFGTFSGISNTIGESNSFFGVGAGIVNTQGSQNAFFGNEAGQTNSDGFNNTFIGVLAGALNTYGYRNTIIGHSANVGAIDLNNATAIGANAVVSQSDSLILGNEANVGIGTSTPGYKLHVVNTSNLGLRVETSATGNGNVASFGGNGDFRIDAPKVSGGRFIVRQDGNVGIGITDPSYKLQVLDSQNSGLRVHTETAGGTVASFGGSGAFQVDAPGVAGGRLNISENGNVGIGTGANPLFKFQTRTGVDENLAVRPASAFNGTLTGIALQSVNDVNTAYKPLDLEGSQVTMNVGSGGNVGIGTPAPNAKLEVNGYTKLGSDAPSIRVKKVTGTTAATEGGFADIPHGLDTSRILSVSVMVNYGGVSWVGPDTNYFSNTRFSWVVNNGGISIRNVFGASDGILSKPVKILIIYEQ